MDEATIRGQIRPAVGAGFEAGLQQARTAMAPVVNTLVYRTTSTTRIEPYAAPSQLPGMRKELAVGQPLQVDMLTNKSIEVANTASSGGIRVNTDDVADDVTGQIGEQARKLGTAAQYDFYKAVIDTLVDTGASSPATGFDGKALIADDHPRDLTGAGSGTNDNKGTTALSADSFQTGVTAMMNFQDAEGRKPWNIAMRLVLIVPPALKKTAQEIVDAALIGGGNTNVQQGSARLLVVPELVETDHWWIVNEAGGKPILMQVRQTPRMDEDRTKLVSENALIYRARYRGAVAPWDYTGIYGGIV